MDCPDCDPLEENGGFEFSEPDGEPEPGWQSSSASVDDDEDDSSFDCLGALALAFGGLADKNASGVASSSSAFQVIDLRGFDLTTQSRVKARALFDREPTATEAYSGLHLAAFAGDPEAYPADATAYTELALRRYALSTDEERSTWEALLAEIILPEDTDFLVVFIEVFEDPFGTTSSFDPTGHYVDDVRVELERNGPPLGTYDLTLRKRVDQDEVGPEGQVEFSITVRNEGPDDAFGVTVADVLPEGLTPTDASTTQGYYDPLSGQWNVDDLPNGAQAMLTLRATAQATTTNTAAITAGDEGDTDAGNNTDAATVTVVQETGYDLDITKTVSSSTVTPSGEVTFTITVTNSGPQTAADVAVQDIISTDGSGTPFTYTDHSTTHGTYSASDHFWSIGSLDAGETAELRVTGLVHLTLTNTATIIDGLEEDTNSNNNSDSASVTVVDG